MAFGLLSLAAMSDTDLIDDWTIYDPLKNALRMGDSETDKVFKDEDESFRARHLRAMFRTRGKLEEITTAVATLTTHAGCRLNRSPRRLT
jgi:hypothetical protein